MNDIEKFLKYLADEAKAEKRNAEFSGSWGDGGCNSTMTSIMIYRAGQKGTIPDAWKKDYIEFNKINDPDFAEYVRLNKKFGNL